MLNLGADQTICQGSSITLTAPNGYSYYNWSDNTHGKTIDVSSTGIYSVEVGNIGTTNLVQNGDFESGYVNFTTSYTKQTTSQGPWGPLSNAGSYQINTKPSLAHSNYSSTGTDHTVAPGTKMFICNGSGTAGTMVWSQTVTVNPNTDYVLGAWFMSVITDPNVAQLQFFINGVQIGSIFNLNPTKDIWEQFKNSWNSGSSTSAVLTITNQNSVNTGNDFAMDDITFFAACIKKDEINITVSPFPTQSTTTVPKSSCSGPDDGEITINSPTAVEYSFDNGVSWQTSNTKTNLAAKTYTVQSKNSAGCFVSSNVTVSSNGVLPSQTIATTPVSSCVGSPDGSITITCATAVEYSFDNGNSWVTSNSKNALAVGVYNVMSKNAAGCTVTDPVTISSSVTLPVQTISSVSPTSCSGISNGEITISSATAVDFSFDGGTTWGSANVKSNLAGGAYVVKSRNSDGCEVSSTVNLVSSSGTPPTLLLSATSQTVCQNTSVTLTAAATGGSTFSFVWSDFTSNTDTQTFTPVTTKSYGVKAINQDGCESVVSSILITVLPPISASITSTTSICKGGSETLKVSAISGGLAPYSVAWTISGTPIAFGTEYTVSPTTNTTYSAIVTDVCGSTPKILTTSLSILPSVISPFNIDNPSQCFPAEFSLSNTINPSLIKSLVWEISNGDTIYNQNLIKIKPNKAGNYDVKLKIISKDGCQDSVKVANSLQVYPLPIPDFNYTIIAENESTKIDFINTSKNASSYSWKFEGGNPSSSTNVDYSTTIVNNKSGEYLATLIAYSDHNCMDSIHKLITVKKEMHFFAPNSFSPNGDAFNQTWKVYMTGYSSNDFELFIYNRWGQLVWFTTDQSAVWDGTYKSNSPIPGIYNWVLIAKDELTDKKYSYNGTINLLK